MFRTLLTAVVLTSATAAVAACGGEGSGPKMVAGAPAGDVTEVTGTVTATRDGKTRPLVVGDVVSGDDVIETGADGHVAIRLHHNLVPWTLGPGKKEQVSLSLAWKAPRATQTSAGPTGERSGAAGRHAEREAADTSATAAAATEEVAAADEKMKADEPAARAAAPAPAEPSPAPPPPPADKEAAPRAAAATATLADKSGGGGGGGELLGNDVGDAFGSGGLGVSGTGAGGGGTGEGSIGLGGIGTIGKGGGTGQGQGYGAGAGRLGARAKPSNPSPTLRVFAASGGLDKAIVTRVVRSRQARLFACVESEGAVRANIKMIIKPDGKVDAVTVSGVSGKATDCLTKWMRATSFPSAKSLTEASLVVQGVDPLDGL